MQKLPTRLQNCSECCLTKTAWSKIIHEPSGETLRELIQNSQQEISTGLFTLIENLLTEAEIDQEDEEPGIRFMEVKPPLTQEAISRIYAKIHLSLATSHLKNFVHEDSHSPVSLLNGE